MIKKQGFFSSLPPCWVNGASSIRNEVRVSFLFWPYTHWPLWHYGTLWTFWTLMTYFWTIFWMLWTFISCFSSASFRIEVASILFFIVNRCNILKLNDSCPLFSNLTRANDYGKWEMKTDMEHAGRVSVSSFISVKVGVFLRQILFYILKEIKIFGFV